MRNYLPKVREQYETLPYPPRNPEDEKHRLISTINDSLNEINYFYFEGKRDFNDDFRVLVAGGGTGDATIYLADQLKDTSAEIVYLDFSEASMKVAQERAKVRGLKNITWVHDSLLNIPELKLGEFDYINCSGVLHHLEKPEDGLKALASVLKKSGVIKLMLYGKYGRALVYPVQELMRTINQNEEDVATKIRNCKTVLASANANTFYLNSVKNSSQDIKENGDAGIYDLLLHSQDRAYSVSDIYQLAESGGLLVQDLYSSTGYGKRAYRPETYIKDKELIEKVNKLNRQSQQLIAEIINGKIGRHFVALVKQPCPTPPDVSALNYVPVFRNYDPKALVSAFEKGNSLRLIAHNGIVLDHDSGDAKHLAALCQQLDSRKTLGEMYDAVRAGLPKDQQPSNETLIAELQPLFQFLNDLHLMFLVRKG